MAQLTSDEITIRACGPVCGKTSYPDYGNSLPLDSALAQLSSLSTNAADEFFISTEQLNALTEQAVRQAEDVGIAQMFAAAEAAEGANTIGGGYNPAAGIHYGQFDSAPVEIGPCLGWRDRAKCCPRITWFWAAAIGAAVLVAMNKGGKQ